MLVLQTPTWVALTVLAGAAATGLAISYPFWSLYMLLCLFFFPMNIGELSLTQAVGALALMFGFANHLFRRGALRAGPFLVPLLLFSGVMFLSFLYARYPEYVWGNCRRFLLNILLYLLITVLVDSFTRLHQILGAYLLTGTANAVYGIYTVAATGQSLERASGFVGNANHLGYICAFAVPIAFHRYVHERRWLTRAAYLGLCGVLITGALSTASRGATLSLVAGLVVCLYQMRRRLLLLLPLVFVTGLSLPFAPELFFHRLSHLGEDVEQSVNLDAPRELTSRGYLHKSGIKVWRDYPFLGVGVGNFGRYFSSINYNPGWARGHEISQHNVYLRVLVENGLVGFLVFSWILWRLAGLYRTLFLTPASSLSAPVICVRDSMIASVVVWAVMGLSMDFLYVHELYMLLALTYVTYRCVRGEISSPGIHQPASSS